MDRVIAAQVYNRICELGSLSAAQADADGGGREGPAKDAYALANFSGN